MREFNTMGPCDPVLHYTVMREVLIAEGREKVEKGRYFTIFAPRQTGKTTYFQLLMKELQKSDFLPVWISLENLKTEIRQGFYEDFERQVKRELSGYGVQSDFTIRGPRDLTVFFEKTQSQTCRIVLIIDEFEGIPDIVLSELMHSFRKIYHQKQHHVLHSLILVGVSTIAELVMSSASPFNIADELQIPYFTFDEVQNLIGQYTAESGQVFEPDAIRAVYDNTAGQPGLVCGLCAYMVRTLAQDRSRPVTVSDYYKAQTHFLTERFDKNIINIVQKAREKRSFMIRLLFNEEPRPFSIHDPDTAWLYANGVIGKDNGNTDISVPLYKKALITAFRPLVNGETGHYITSPHDTVSRYLNPDGGLNVSALLEEYRAYVRRRGFLAFDTENLKEAACHYSLDGFISFFIQCLEGQTFIEVPSGKGRTDILIIHNGRKYIIEVKRFTSDHYFQKGKTQLAEYLKSENLSEGWYAVFSTMHTDADELRSEELIGGSRIHTHIIPVKFKPPTLMKPEKRKQTSGRSKRKGKKESMGANHGGQSQ